MAARNYLDENAAQGSGDARMMREAGEREAMRPSAPKTARPPAIRLEMEEMQRVADGLEKTVAMLQERTEGLCRRDNRQPGPMPGFNELKESEEPAELAVSLRAVRCRIESASSSIHDLLGRLEY